MIKRNQSSVTLLNSVTTNTVQSQTQFIQFQHRADDTSGTDVNFIIVLIAVQLDLHAVLKYHKLEQKLFAVFTVQCISRFITCVNSEVDFKLELACSIHGVVGH